MQKLRVGVIGVGKMGRHHARAYHSLDHLCEFIGIYDVDSEAAAEVSRQYDVIAFDGVEGLLDRVDAVTIAAPTYYHCELAAAALRRGIHVLVEKPVCRSVQEARELHDLARETGVTAQVGHIERFNPAVQQLAKIIPDEEIIAIDIKRTGPFDPRVKDLDVIQDMMVHDIDILRYLLGAEITDVVAHARRVKSPVFADHAVCTATLDNGVIATMTASRVTEQKQRIMNITCQEAYIELDFMERRLALSRDTRIHYASNGEDAGKLENRGERIFVPDREPLIDQTKHFLHCIRTETAPLIGMGDGLAALEIVQRVQDQVYKETVPRVSSVAV